MDADGAGDIDLGSDGTGVNPVVMMAGMALDRAVGQNMMGIINSAMSQTNYMQSGVTLVPVPIVVYHVAVNGQATICYTANSAHRRLI